MVIGVVVTVTGTMTCMLFVSVTVISAVPAPTAVMLIVVTPLPFAVTGVDTVTADVLSETTVNDPL